MSKTYPYGTGPVKWVSTKWLAENLDHASLVILDVQPSIHDYIQAHIPGAVYMAEGVLKVARQGIPSHLIPAGAMQPILCSLGVQVDLPVLVYTGAGGVTQGGDGLEQAVVAYALARFGCNYVYILDGGLDKWQAEGWPLTKTLPQVEESELQVQVRRDYFLEYEEFKSLYDRDGVLVVDSRPARVYAEQMHWSKPGHIPGAINLPWTILFDVENPRLLRSVSDMQATLDQHGITPEKTIVCVCGTGRKAASQFLIFRHYLGFPRVRLYEGSFTEWSAHAENPTVVGSEPR